MVAPPSRVSHRRKDVKVFIYNGIDRIDSNRGYEINNCVTCCTYCNKMKLDHSQESFKEQIKRVYYNWIYPNEGKEGENVE